MCRRNDDYKRKKVVAIFMACIVIVIIFSTSGCAQINQALQVAASINDEALERAHDLQCKRASIRAIKERFNTPEKRRAYNLICGVTLHETE